MKKLGQVPALQKRTSHPAGNHGPIRSVI